MAVASTPAELCHRTTEGTAEMRLCSFDHRIFDVGHRTAPPRFMVADDAILLQWPCGTRNSHRRTPRDHRLSR
jgi:hypothetical protein